MPTTSTIATDNNKNVTTSHNGDIWLLGYYAYGKKISIFLFVFQGWEWGGGVKWNENNENNAPS